MNGYNQFKFRKAIVNSEASGDGQVKRIETRTTSPIKAANYNQNQYQKMAVNTADPGKLVVMLYEGAIKYLLNAIEAANEKKVDVKCNNINRAYDIIQELQFALDMEQGGEIALNLYRLYQFMMSHLIKSKINRDGITMIEDVIRMLKRLNEAWRAITSEARPVENHQMTGRTANPYGNQANSISQRIAV